MTVTGIIAEFNPFHNGHAYLLSQAKGVKIVAMSGNFTQRGEPAIVDKWTRAQMALEHGADLVVELPFLVTVQAADFFAQGAVDILTRLGIEQLSFGSEELLDYGKIAELYDAKRAEMTDFMVRLPDSLSYPEKTQAMWQNFAGLTFSGNTPNHVLALAYAKAVAGRGIALHPIKRKGAGFHSLDSHLEFASATALRSRIDDTDFVAAFSPSADLILQAVHVSWTDYFPYLRYQILSNPNLTEVYQVNQEMASRIKEAIKNATSFEGLVEKVATKRYTKARVRRLLTYILIQTSESPLPEAIRVLGFTEKGRKHLASLKKKVPLVSRVGKDPWDRLSQKADKLYQLGHPSLSEQNIGRVPIGIDQ
ncbi:MULTISPECIES: nucleotidyltransferase [unclassified Streptococcus]|uniref:nucleotidyltransferase n=1 Tax=unclassified Streptococcus TaxID=2608887 RepID=UPI0010726BF7|nr:MULTISPECIES: nucleotidyltransferase [unclassified Streptococcus]MBF0787826.1 nucleotidyltransferase [Streptococcus sp. 19428wC2_LYSM12]MCQ9211182.1 nucleotidyltransferase [Streptococcus sp. B01]MCQ9214457.1 nucleotidyltransferase [Streptococcus sp. O1]TFV05149.1 nucleotidyltransferase [Streptococcus sp. LYSM12]